METYGTEEEQVEALKRWWQENGRSIVAAAVLAIGGALGWQYWQQHQETQRLEASEAFQGFIESMGGPDGSTADVSQMQARGEQLKIDYPDSGYANFTALHLARLAAQSGDLAGAEQQLRWVLAHKADIDTQQVAQLRLARVLAAAGDTDAALAILQASEGGAYAASWAIALGDVQLLRGERQQATLTYEKARLLAAQALGGSANLPMLEQKLASLATAAAQPEAAAPVMEAAVDAEDAPDA